MAVTRHFFLLLLFADGCFAASYLAQQSGGQFQLLRARRRIETVLGDPAISEDTKRRLRVAQAAREFAVRTLGLRGGDEYSSFVDTHGDPIAWNLTAAPKDELRAKTHTFPLVGAVPYLGYFRESDARKQAANLQAQGFDTYLRAVAGYSTLGYLSDPIYSSMLEGSDARVVEVMLHEMLHATVYLSSHSEWNESLATLVGLEGAALFFSQGRPSEVAELFAEARRQEEKQAAFSDFLQPILRELQALYAQPISQDEKLRRREIVFARIKVDFLARFPTAKGSALVKDPINNAVLVALSVYHRGTTEHRQRYEALHRDLRGFVALYKHAVEDMSEPLDYLAAYFVRTKMK